MITNATNICSISEGHAEKLYDMCMIERLCHFNKERILKLVQVFIEQAPQAMEEIKQAFAKGDLATVKKTAHRIKPTLSYYAIVKVEKDILSIEKMAKTGEAGSGLQTAINNADNIVAAVVTSMKQEFFNN